MDENLNTAEIMNSVAAPGEISGLFQTTEVPDRRHRFIFAAAVITAFLFTLCFKGINVHAGLSSVLFFNAAGIIGLVYLKMLGMLKRKKGIILMAPIFLLSCFNAYFEYSEYNTYNSIAFFVLLTGMLLYCSGIETKLKTDSFFNIFFNRMWLATTLSASSVASKKFSIERFAKIAGGLILSIPVLLVIGALLASGDDAFAAATVKLFYIDPTAAIWTVIVFVFIFTYSCGYYYRFIETEQKIVFAGHNIDSAAAAAFLTPVNLLFLFFCYSQFSYIGDGVPLTDFTTYSSFAHEGFFQLLWVTFINFSIILVFTDILKLKTKGFLKFSLMMLCVFTFVLIISSFYRMYLYMNVYGFTPLRIEVITFLSVESVLIFTTLYSIAKNRHDIIQDFVIAAVFALFILNFTARYEFSAALNNKYNPKDYEYMTIENYTHETIPLLIEKYKTETNEMKKIKIANRVYHLYKCYDKPKNWQSFEIQGSTLQKTAKEFLEEIEYKP